MLNSTSALSMAQLPHSTSSFLSGGTSLQTLAARAQSGAEMKPEEMQEVGRNFEAVLLHQLLSTMRRSIPRSDLFGDSSTREMYEDMFDQVIAEQAASSGQTGLGEMIVQELERIQQCRVTSTTSNSQRGSNHGE